MCRQTVGCFSVVRLRAVWLQGLELGGAPFRSATNAVGLGFRASGSGLANCAQKGLQVGYSAEPELLAPCDAAFWDDEKIVNCSISFMPTILKHNHRCIDYFTVF